MNILVITMILYLLSIYNTLIFLILIVASGRAPIDAIIDGISFKFPPSPPLSQPMDISDDQYCNRRTMSENCENNLCSCTHKLDIPLNAIVEIVLVDECEYIIIGNCK